MQTFQDRFRDYKRTRPNRRYRGSDFGSTATPRGGSGTPGPNML